MSLTKTAAELLAPAQTSRPTPPEPRLAPVTRIDFHYVNQTLPPAAPRYGWQVFKYLDGWTASTPAAMVESDPPLKPTPEHPEPRPFDLDEALARLEAAGWTVHRWQGGARAWKGPALPVRTREQIRSMRRRFTAELIRTAGHPHLTTFADLAYDY